MTIFKDLFQNRGIRRMLVLIILVLFLYAFKSMLNMMLITFILAYLVNRLSTYLTKRFKGFVTISQKAMSIGLYVLFLAGLTLGVYLYLPKLIAEVNDLFHLVMSFYKTPVPIGNSEILNYLMDSLQKLDLASYINQGVDFLVLRISEIGKWGLNFFIAVILSFFLLLEKEKVLRFIAKFKKSKIGWIFKELEFFGRKFIHSFGKVIEVQFLIALINSLLSTLLLWIMGFPNLIVLAVMILLLGLIPVAGVVISLIPLCIIAFKIGGFIKVVYVILMIILLHAFEAYFLNPKLMSSKMHLPIFFTLTILVVSEHLYGVWGLILGIPVFMFLLDLFDVPVTNQKAESKPT